MSARGFIHWPDWLPSDPAARTYEALRLNRLLSLPSARARCACGRFVTRDGVCARCGVAS